MINSKYNVICDGYIKFLTNDLFGSEYNGKYSISLAKYRRLHHYIDEEGNEVPYINDSEDDFFFKLFIDNKESGEKFICFLGNDSDRDEGLILVYKTLGAKHWIDEKLKEKGMTLDELNEDIFVRNGDVTYIDVLLNRKDEYRSFHGQSRISINKGDNGIIVTELDNVVDETNNLVVIGADYRLDNIKIGKSYQYLKDNYEAITKPLFMLCDSLSNVKIEEILSNIDSM